MRRSIRAIGMVLLSLSVLCLAALAEGPPSGPPPYCEPGFEYVQVVEYQEHDHPVCKIVPNKRSKWLYSSKPDYFCLPGCPLHVRHDECGCDVLEYCPTCKGPYCRCQLLKKKVEWTCGTKCVVEVVKEKVPCVVWRKVPRKLDPNAPARAPEIVPPPEQVEEVPAPRPVRSPKSP